MVIVIGGGVIGLSIAREVRGEPVLLIESGNVGEGTSWAAAGMLSPLSEADDQGPFFQLCMASFQTYARFAHDLRVQTGVDPEFEQSGLLLLASSNEELSTIQKRCEWQRAAGFDTEIISSEDVLKLEPRITAEVSGALFLRGDQQIHPRKLLAALRSDCVKRGVEIRTQTRVDAIVSEKGRVAGVRVGVELIPARVVVVASGVWSGTIDGVEPKIPMQPRKGQILSLTLPPESFKHMIRWRHCYFIPRRDGELVVGATDEDAGFDRSLTPAGVGRLLTEAQQISSHVAAFPIRETWTGLRPATPDGLPLIGPSRIDGLLYATGHYRNGILLAPITAAIIAAVVDGEPLPLSIDPFLPSRFN